MADTNSNCSLNRRKNGRRFSSKLVPDMTPMVGLGFMLVTFFIMAADFAKSSVMQLTMPVIPVGRHVQHNDGIICRSALTIILDKNHQVHYFFGLNGTFEDQPQVYTTDFSQGGLRQVLLNLQRVNPYTLVLIKTTAAAKYKDMVDVLDEMNITNQRKYAMVDMYPEDRELLKLNAL